MEIHKSHGVHSVRDFTLEIAMIVIGVLIALGVEQVREHFHEQHLADAARETFRREIDLEREVINAYIARIADSRGALTKMLNDPELRAQADLKLPESLNWQFLPTEAWDTAVATQAFSYMPPDEVQRYALIHASQNIFNSFAQKQHDLLMDLYSYRGRKDLTLADISARNHDIGLVLGYSGSIDQISHELLRDFDAVSSNPVK